MPKLHVNLVPPEDQEQSLTTFKKPKSPWRNIIITLVVIFMIVLAIFSSMVVFSDGGLIKNLSKLNLFGQFGKLVSSRERMLNGEAEDRINFLLIGIGGKQHQGGTLADTIILASYQPSTGKVAMMSIPRDMSIPVGNYRYEKINAVSAYAEKEVPGSGGPALATKLEELLGTTIQYTMTVDFDGFEKLIDEFGGVDVIVDRDLVDYRYPIRGKEYVFPIENRFEVLRVKAGPQHMEGDLALKYARSRHGLGIEGSDFARSQRQQKILAALKDKIFTVDTFMNPKKVNSLLSAYNEHIVTNLEMWEIMRLAQIGKNIDTNAIIHQNLTDGADSLLRSAMIGGAYMLLPKDKTYEEIKMMWTDIFSATSTASKYSGAEWNSIIDKPKEKPKTPTTTVATTTPTNPPTTTPTTTPATSDDDITLPSSTTSFTTEGASIEIQNGTWITGYATKEMNRLTKLGFTVAGTGNASSHDFTKTVVYDLSGGKYPATAKELTKVYGSKPSISSTIQSTADFVVILGQK